MWDLPAAELAQVLPSIDVNEPDEFGERFLTVACSRLQVESVRLLLTWGADVNARNLELETPLHCAIDVVEHNPSAAHQIVMMLLDAGAILESRGYMDKTPFLKACSRGDLEMLKLLVNRGCDVRAVSLELGAPFDGLDFANTFHLPTECIHYVQAIFKK
jgi:ankyrin repeat protein